MNIRIMGSAILFFFIDKYLSCVRQLDPIIAAKEGVEAQL